MRERVISKSLAGPSEICMLMPIRKGFADGLETRSYESRLRSFTKLFSDLRALSRESRLVRPYSDIVDRIRTIHGVTIAIVDEQLLLAVHFDQPWEPYIQVIWRELGHIFDAILCNCEGYVENNRNELGYEAFAAWIRKYQLNTNTFYMNSAHTVSDVIYLDQLERRVRRDGTIDGEALAGQSFATPEAVAAVVREEAAETQSDYVEYIKLGVQAVSAFHALTHMYPKDSPDHQYILNAARSVLPGDEFPRRDAWLFADDPSLASVKQFFAVELDWFENFVEPAPRYARPRHVAHDPDNVQSGISESYSERCGVNQGCLALVQVVDPEKARRFLRKFSDKVNFGLPERKADMYRNIGFTAQGLRRLGLPEDELDKFPRAFLEGMASRAGLIGDLRTNHPDRWTLPERNWPVDGAARVAAQRVNLESVDMIIQLRHKTKSPGPDIARAFVRELEKLEKLGKGGILIAAVQPTYSLPGKREHFGFRDGLSQPEISNPPIASKPNQVPSGELFIGYPRGANSPLAKHWSEPLFKDGTFQVVRKLAQHVDRLERCVKRNAEASGRDPEALLTYMMGRNKVGDPLVEPARTAADGNDFDYGEDSGGVCPMWAHVRRANPRDRAPGPRDLKTQEVIPRIMRTGMSFGPADGSADRGLVFQCFNADLAEQFEIVQQWISGDNRTAPYSQLSDPFLGVPQKGEPRTFWLADGTRLDLGDEPFVTLRWGAYLFVPSRVGLETLADMEPDTTDYAARGQEIIDALGAIPSSEFEQAHDAWKRLLEEKESRDAEDHRAVWTAVRENYGGVLPTPFGVLVGRRDLIDEVLSDDTKFSVSAYKERLDKGVKENYLGMDEPDHGRSADGPNAQFRRITRRQGFAAATKVAAGLLQGVGGIAGSVTLPLPKYADLLLANVAAFWFGMPDGEIIKSGGEPMWDPQAEGLADTVHCPYHFISTSRAVFQPAPSSYVMQTAESQGATLRRGVDELVALMEANGCAALEGDDPTKKRLKRLHGATPEGEFADVLLGALLGFMPTVQGNFLEAGRDWLRSGDFWTVQNLYLDRRKRGADPWLAAEAVLLPRLIRAMAIRPVPSLIHRTARKRVRLGDVIIEQGQSVVVGLVSATAEGGFTDIEYVFGGPWYEGSGSKQAIHACPGRELGIGTLLGMFAGLFEAGGYLRGASSPMALQYNARALED